jgi:hypothetical protein
MNILFYQENKTGFSGMVQLDHDFRERAKRVSFSLYNQYVNRYQMKWYYYFTASERSE